jgi:hypothetical protein
LQSDTTAAQVDYSSGFGVQSVSSTGFELGGLGTGVNGSTKNYVSWTFRKQPKFFDVVTYTGTGATQHDVAHNLGSVPGFIIVKDTSQTSSWRVAARKSDGTYCGLSLNNTNAASPASVTAANAGIFSTYVDFGNTGFSGQIASVNVIGATYVAYLFAHNAGGFGLAGTDNVISCGSFSGGGATVNLGWEPQWILAKRTDTTGNWYIDDNMRGWPAAPQNDNPLLANTADAEPTGYAGFANITSTGFTNNFNGDYIYIAIRRGPMKVPTVGTSVYNGITRAGNSTSTTFTGAGFVPDLISVCARDTSSGFIWQDRLRGATRPMFPAITQAESTYANEVTAINQDGITVGTDTPVNQSGYNYINHFFGRAPGFFDEVCYTGTGSATTFSHNLSAVPELIIVKKRFGGTNRGWWVYASPLTPAYYLNVNTTSAAVNGGTIPWNNTNPTSAVFSVSNDDEVNGSTNSYVAYLFATCAGVSKVGSYTGNGSSQTIACGFTAGSRFVLIKRTDSTGDWYVWDSARGIVAGNDPHLSLNTTAAEVTTDDSVDTDNSGFIVNQLAATNVNVTSATYIFLAVS